MIRSKVTGFALNLAVAFCIFAAVKFLRYPYVERTEGKLTGEGFTAEIISASNYGFLKTFIQVRFIYDGIEKMRSTVYTLDMYNDIQNISPLLILEQGEDDVKVVIGGKSRIFNTKLDQIE